MPRIPRRGVGPELLPLVSRAVADQRGVAGSLLQVSGHIGLIRAMRAVTYTCSPSSSRA